MPDTIITRLVTEDDTASIATLHARVFGPGRFARTAYRVREGHGFKSPYCRAALDGGRLIAALRFTSITIGGRGQALLLGPLAVDPEFAGQGFGRRLITEGLDDARARGQRAVVLVGDLPYYARFGFKPVPPGQIVFPGPVNPSRILVAELVDGAAGDYRGVVAATDR